MIQKIGDAAPQENLSLPKIRKFGLAASDFTGNSISKAKFIGQQNPHKHQNFIGLERLKPTF